MNIGIEINGEFLDLPGTTFEVVRNSPYFNNDEMPGEYSIPFSIPYTEKNYRLLNYYGNHYKNHKKEVIDAKLHGGISFMHVGKLIVDGFDKNNNLPGSQLTNGLFTFGVGGFFQEVKGKKLSDLSLGGNRTFNWTTNNPYDGSNGFWQHVLTVSQNPVDYSFIPIRNDGYGYYANDTRRVIDSMNLLDMTAHTVQFFDYTRNVSSLCPSIRLSYLIQQVFKENGWTVDGEVFSDATFNKLFAQSFNSIYWCNYATAWFLGATVINVFPLSTIDIKLNEHVPPDYTITDFIIDLKNRYALGFNFDTDARHCTVSFLKSIKNSAAIDITKYVHSRVVGKTDAATKVYSLKTIIDTAAVVLLLCKAVCLCCSFQ